MKKCFGLFFFLNFLSQAKETFINDFSFNLIKTDFFSVLSEEYCSIKSFVTFEFITKY